MATKTAETFAQIFRALTNAQKNAFVDFCVGKNIVMNEASVRAFLKHDAEERQLQAQKQEQERLERIRLENEQREQRYAKLRELTLNVETALQAAKDFAATWDIPFEWTPPEVSYDNSWNSSNC